MAEPPQEHTIQTYIKGDEIWGDNNDRRTDEVLFVDGSRTWKVYRAADDPVPEPGESLKGWLNEGKGTFGIAKERSQNGGERRSSSSTAGGKTYDRQPDHPVQMLRALHTSAMSAAPDYYRLFREENALPAPTGETEAEKLDRMKATLEAIVTWLEGGYPQAVLDQAAKADIPVPGSSAS